MYLKLTILSDIPDSVYPLPYNNKIQVYINDIPGIEDDLGLNNLERKDKINTFMSNNLLIVQPLKTMPNRLDNKNYIFFQGKNIKVLEKHKSFDYRSMLTAIPTFYRGYNNINDVYQFVNLLQQRSIIGKLFNPWSLNPDDIPLGIIWKDLNVSYLFFDINKQSNNPHKGIAFKLNSFKHIILNNKWFEEQYKNSDLTYVYKSFISYQIFHGDHKSFSYLDNKNHKNESNAIIENNLILYPSIIFDDNSVSNINNLYQFQNNYLTHLYKTAKFPLPYPFGNNIPFGFIWKSKNESYFFFDIYKTDDNTIGINSLKFLILSNEWIINQHASNNIIYMPKNIVYNNKDKIHEYYNDDSYDDLNKNNINNHMYEHDNSYKKILDARFKDDSRYNVGIIVDKDSFSYINNLNQFKSYYLNRLSKSPLHESFNYHTPFCFIWKDSTMSYLFFDIYRYKHNKIRMNSLDFIIVNNEEINKYDRVKNIIFLPKNIINNNKNKIKTNNKNKIKQLDFFDHYNQKLKGKNYTINSSVNFKINNIAHFNKMNIDNKIDSKINEKINSKNSNSKLLDDKVVNHDMKTNKDDILDKFFNTIHSTKYNLTFSKDDVINFHNSIKSNMLTLLTGLSGTGKSKITTAYADALGIKNNDQLNMVSVRPFWQDDADLLGFVNTLNNTYNPGDSGLVDTLIHAQFNPDKLHLIVLDEMNLARIEHYFSQFLSVLEKNQEDRYIQLYNKTLEPRLYNSHRYPYSIKIPNNIRFIGTMNVDETTFQVSDKVLDRANVITLKQQSFLNMSETGFNNVNNDKEISYKEYVNSIYDNESKLSREELEFFDTLNYCIKRSLPNVGISWRTINNIERFLSNVSHYDYASFGRKDALDYQISQRILPKLRGTESMLSDLLNLSTTDKENENSIESVLKNYNNLSNFKDSKSSLNKKIKEIRVIGFAN